jgi:hypothetical protein
MLVAWNAFSSFDDVAMEEMDFMGLPHYVFIMWPRAQNIR